MGWADVDDRIDLVAKRVDLLEALAAGPRYKPALVEATGDSRSTVDRAIRELEAAGLIERTDEGFRATLAGRLAAERYRAFVELGAVDRAAATALALVEACAEAGARADARAWVDRLRELTDDAALGEYREAVAAWNDRLASD